MKVYRLSKKKYAKTLSGKGASKFANRWNSKGTEIIYSAESRALAMAEVVVHLTIATLPPEYVIIEIEVPDNIQVKEIKAKDLPKNWNNHPAATDKQKIGDDFIQALDYCVLKVPSAVVQGDYNYLLNPHHEAFKEVKILTITDFPFDKRIFE